MPHPSENDLVEYAGGILPDALRAQVGSHLEECSDCTQLVQRLSSGHSATVVPGRAPAPRSEGPGLEAGTAIGRYRVLGVVGAGAMGVVYSAHDPELHRIVAVKLLRDNAANVNSSEGRARLLLEAQALARLSHRNVVAIHDVGIHQGQLFIAMEFVEGMTLREWQRAAPRSWQETLTVFKGAARGLAAAHAAGLVHRDFK